MLITYVETYLKEEILAEGIIRQLDLFSRFLDICGLYSGEILNYSNIARESAVALKTVQNYFQILEDTLIAFKLSAWDKSIKKQLALHPKFYFFDNGINSVLTNRLSMDISGDEKGKLFEQWCINEVRALKFYSNSLLKLNFWRTQAGSEVDLLIVDQANILCAIEFKYKNKLSKSDFSGLKSFHEDYQNVPRIMVYKDKTSYISDNLEILSYLDFSKEIKRRYFSR